MKKSNQINTNLNVRTVCSIHQLMIIHSAPVEVFEFS